MLLLLALACSDTETPHEHNDNELITTVVLELTPTAGDALVFEWEDLEADGSPEVDTIELAPGEYALHVDILNRLEEPPEDIGAEVAAEGEEHQLFFMGSAIDDGLLGYTYGDQDEGGLPIGLDGELSVLVQGDGELGVLLRHMPEQDGALTKTEGLAQLLADEGVAALPGGTDAEVYFPVEVVP